MSIPDNKIDPWDFATPEKKLRSYFLAHRPIIYINGSDFREIDKLISEQSQEAFRDDPVNIDEFSLARGRQYFKNKETFTHGGVGGEYTIEEFLKVFDTANFPKKEEIHLLILKEVHDKLTEPCVYSLLQSIAGRMRESVEGGEEENKYYVQVLIVDSQLRRIPPELEELVALIEMKPPRIEEIKEIIKNFTVNNGVQIEDDFSLELPEALAGLSKYAINQLLRLATINTPRLDSNMIGLIREEKRQMVQKSGLIEFIDYDGLAAIGGHQALTSYIEDTKSIFSNPGLAKEHGVATPKGIMIVGMPGCGKSLMAKKIAEKFNVPLLKLDIGRLMGKYVGESENNLHRAIAIAEAASPCVLWIDEIEKAFSGIGEDGGGGSAMTRMFGIFLTWMQEKTASIYVIATSNNIDKLPSEFLRRGRFDEIFSADFPTADECKEILKNHISKSRPSLVPKLDQLVNDDVVKALKGKNYSGADLENIVNDLMKSAFLKQIKRTTNTADDLFDANNLLEIVKQTKSSYSAQKEKLDEMRKRIEKHGVRPTSGARKGT